MGLSIQTMLEKGIASTTLEFKITLVRAITLETGEIDLGCNEICLLDHHVIPDLDHWPGILGRDRKIGCLGGDAVGVLVQIGWVEPEFRSLDLDPFRTILDTPLAQNQGLFSVRKSSANDGPFLKGMLIGLLHGNTA